VFEPVTLAPCGRKLNGAIPVRTADCCPDCTAKPDPDPKFCISEPDCKFTLSFVVIGARANVFRILDAGGKGVGAGVSKGVATKGKEAAGTLVYPTTPTDSGNIGVAESLAKNG
jgi:hypothetical protein